MGEEIDAACGKKQTPCPYCNEFDYLEKGFAFTRPEYPAPAKYELDHGTANISGHIPRDIPAMKYLHQDDGDKKISYGSKYRSRLGL